YSGARSLVPTSGGGFALMGEGVSLIGVSETPMVIILAQRPGPATGLPTRTEQADLELALASGHGEFPRAILTPGSIEDCFFQTHKAFDLAERFQTLSIVLVDQYLTDSIRSVAPFKLEELPEIPGPGDDIQAAGTYERYAWSETGVSPRIIPGKGKQLVVADSHEHTPDGHITEDQDIRTRMVDKRLKKMQGLKQEVFPPDYQGPDEPDLLLVSWGSSRGAVQEAADRLQDEGRSVATLHFSQVWPLLPEHCLERLQNAGSVICVEGNATAQFAGLIRRETGFGIEQSILRYDGRPLTVDYILAGLKEQQLA
ncbi:MAG: transketolase C-terminal domain-containing protein, partial [Thermodesulfobacteriota bacterium]